MEQGQMHGVEGTTRDRYIVWYGIPIYMLFIDNCSSGRRLLALQVYSD